VLLHQFGEDLVLALELGLEVGELPVTDVGVGLAAFVVGGEGGGAVLEEELLPGIEEGDADAVFFAEIGNRDFVEEVLPKHGDLLFGAKVATLPGHGYSSARVLPLTLSEASSCSDWRNTSPPNRLNNLGNDSKCFLATFVQCKADIILHLRSPAGLC